MWHCKDCEFDNDDLTIQCCICKIESPLSHHYRGLVAIKRGVILEWGFMTPQEELYSKFYNRGKLFVKDMDATQLREHRDKLSEIVLEAKATLASADDELRERKAKTTKKEWLLTPNQPEAVTTDAINAVKVRKERMSKIDKMKAQLLSAGIDEETVKEMISNLERKATESNLKAISFKTTVVEDAIVFVNKEKVIAVEEPKQPFDPSTLKFGN